MKVRPPVRFLCSYAEDAVTRDMTCKWINVCPMRDLERKKIVDGRWRRDFCESADNWKNCVRYRMEEEFLPHSDYMLPDGGFIERYKGA